MQKWLEKMQKVCPLDDDSRGYLLGRGARSSDIERLGLFTWDSDLMDSECPDPVFESKYGEKGCHFDGMITIPCYSPSGRLIGVEARGFPKKVCLKYYLQAAKWSPVWVGIQEATQKIDAGGNVWLVEGIFDLFAMLWVVPSTDAVLSTERAALTWNQVEYLKRWVHGTVYMAYDNDEAGRNAIEGWTDPKGAYKIGILDLLRKVGLPNVVDFRYQGKDPGKVWDDGGRPELERVFAHASI